MTPKELQDYQEKEEIKLWLATTPWEGKNRITRLSNRRYAIEVRGGHKQEVKTLDALDFMEWMTNNITEFYKYAMDDASFQHFSRSYRFRMFQKHYEWHMKTHGCPPKD